MTTAKGTFFFIDVCIQTLEKTLDTTSVYLNLPDAPTLDQVRTLLLAGPLGKPEKDIFFPSWTKSLHILLVDPEKDKKTLTWEEVENNKLTIDTPEKLHEIIAKQEENRGSACLVLQQCRSKRYSRKKDPAVGGQIPTSPVSCQTPSPPGSPAEPILPNNLHGEAIHGGVTGSVNPVMNEVYQPMPPEGMYYEQPFVPLTIVTPPSMYPQCYTIPLGMAPPSMPRYHYLPGPPYVPQMQSGYFGYAVM